MYDGFFDIEKELKKLPAKPGVYIMHDSKDEIIYVGKAISLKNRVKQYFQAVFISLFLQHIIKCLQLLCLIDYHKINHRGSFRQ